MSKKRIGTIRQFEGNATPDSSMEDMEKTNRPITWKEFAGRSTCAAVSHLGDKSTTTLVTLTWRLTLVVSIALTAVSSYYSTMGFMNFSGSSEMIPQSYPSQKMEHPKIHICTSGSFNLTKLAEIGFVDNQMISYLMLMSSVFATSPLLLRNVEQQRQLETKFQKIMTDNNISNVEQIITKAILKCEDIIAGCMVPKYFYDGPQCCAKFFPDGSFLSSTGACVTNFNNQPFSQPIPSMWFGFVVFVKDLASARRKLDNTIISPILANQRGVSFAIGNKLTDPRVVLFEDKFYSRTGMWTSLALSKIIVNDEEVAESWLVKKSCASRNEPDRYMNLVPGFTNYTEKNCNYAMRQQKINQFLGCYMVTLPYKGNLPPCPPNKLLSIANSILDRDDPNSDEKEICVGECWKEVFSFSASFAELQLMTSSFDQYGNFSVSSINQMKIDEVTALNFFYPTFTQTSLVNHYPNLVDWLGVLGGNLGLFLGASMVSAVEVFVFLVGCCRSIIRR